jgi:glyoxylase-like metal-dependent hydrolase (beta-lactamase superfamily II)
MADLVCGQITPLSHLVKRLLAPNPGPFTGPGTNTYLLGRESVAVIDPGPVIDKHIETILSEAGDRIRWIIVTHTHVDHSPAAAVLKSRLDSEVELIGMPSLQQGFSFDKQFKPDRIISHEQIIQSDEFTLKALYTPGHASNHVCYLLEEEKLLFCGDQLMEGSTVIIAPPDGNMAEYIQSLEQLLMYPIEAIAPAHGNIMLNARAVLSQTIAHRLRREQKVVSVLSEIKAAGMEALVLKVYDDVPVFMHPIAQQSLLAHLLKLEAEGRATKRDEIWSLV